MNILNKLLALDLSLLEGARSIIPSQYAYLVQIAGELVVFLGAGILLGIWLFGTLKKDNEPKKRALAIFFTIVAVFALYAIINLGIPQWRPGATEAVQGIAPLISHPIDNSFPSGHALFTGALLFGLFHYYKKNFLILLTILIGILTLSARVVGGVHYPGDIIAGLFFGTFGAFLLRPIVDILVSKFAPIFIRIAGWIRL